MKTRQAYLGMLFIYAGLCSCSKHDSFPEQQQLKEVCISTRASVFDEATTRATDTGFEVGESIGIFAVLHQDGQLKASGNVADNKKWTLTEDNGVKEWKPATDVDKIYYQDAENKLDFYAYYPYNATLLNPLDMQLSVQANQSQGISSSDFMVASNTRGLWRGAVSLQFSHQLSRLELTVVRVLNSTSTANELNASLQVPVSAYKFNLQTEQLTPLEATPQKMQLQYITKNNGDNVNTEIKYLYYLILPPQEIAPSKDRFKFDLDGREYNGKIGGSLIFTAGKRTACDMTLNFNPIFQNN